MLHNPPVIPKLWLVSKCNDSIPSAPSTQLLPPMARYEPVVGIPIAPDIVNLDVRMLLLGVGDEVLNLL